MTAAESAYSAMSQMVNERDIIHFTSDCTMRTRF
jgi:hypothetical protein